jgi:YVTN family beta-propeller protein
VTNIASNDVSIIDTNTNTVVDDPVMVGSAPWQVVISPLPFIKFSTFNVNNLTTDQRHKALFMLSTFELGKDSNGINPTNDTVTLKIGNIPFTIPVGSFKEKHHGLFTYVGQIDKVWIKALIKPLDHNRFGFQVTAYAADLNGIKNPVSVELTVGDDMGITSVNAIFKQNYDTHYKVRDH